jgi:hypothetical protein
MPRVQIFGMARSTDCRGKKKCAVISNLDRLPAKYSEAVEDNPGDKKVEKFKVPAPWTSTGDDYYGFNTM